MTHSALPEVPGMTELLGRGVFTEVPEDVLEAVRDRYAVVAGDPARAAAVALRLSTCATRVTVVTHELARSAGIPGELRRALRGHTNITVRHGVELLWIAGLDHLEAIVLRRTVTGRIEAHNAAALFFIGPTWPYARGGGLWLHVLRMIDRR
jgi:thioredoxin reductase (NADPH)